MKRPQQPQRHSRERSLSSPPTFARPIGQAQADSPDTGRPLADIANVNDQDLMEVIRGFRNKAQGHRQQAAVEDAIADELEDSLNGDS